MGGPVKAIFTTDKPKIESIPAFGGAVAVLKVKVKAGADRVSLILDDTDVGNDGVEK